MYVSTEINESQMENSAQIRFYWSACIDWIWILTFNTLYKMIPFLSPLSLVSPPRLKIKPQHEVLAVGGGLETLNKNKIASSQHWASSKPGKDKEEKWKKTPKEIVTTSKSAHPVNFPSFLFCPAFSSLTWLLRTKDPKSSIDCSYTVWNVKMSMCFYVHNSNGKDSLDPVVMLSQTEGKGGRGEGTQLQVIIYTLKIDPSVL